MKLPLSDGSPFARVNGCRPQIRHGCDATNLKCALLRSLFGSEIASTLLSMRVGKGSDGRWHKRRSFSRLLSGLAPLGSDVLGQRLR